MVIMSVDLGKARTGIAACDNGFLAYPVTVINEKRKEVLLQKVAETVKDKAELVVVGLPKNMDGSEGESAQNARDFAEKLTELTGIKTVMVDERSTTVMAHGFLNETNTRGKKRKAVVDAVAAVLILQSYIDSIK